MQSTQNTNFMQMSLTLYSVRNSVSIRLNLRNSQDNSNAVNIGSRELKAINELDDNAL